MHIEVPALLDKKGNPVTLKSGDSVEYTALPANEYERDLHYLAVFLQGQENSFKAGAYNALNNLQPTCEDDLTDRYQQGFLWATRIKEGLELYYYVNEGEP